MLNPKSTWVRLSAGLALCSVLVWASGIAPQAYNLIQNAGSALTQFSTLNFTGTGVTCANDTNRTTCTVNGVGVANFQQVFIGQTSQSIVHNLGTTAVLTQCFDSSNNFVTPLNIVINSVNQVTVTFNAAQTGYCNVNGASGISALSGTAAISFGPIANASCAVSTVTVTGALTGAAVAARWPSTLETGLFGTMLVSAADTVQIRLCNLSGGSVTPAGQTFGAEVFQ